ncbi:uncharacterized protein LOC106130356 [Amyelois transitella]|uniref:uncharacterized protein LOC106130356 n=1 Tax=Amyelois transitella TaxID=680683 RepID=UPI00067C47A1|nr:uncharacterized protein LOC106130356 [Amyelois transitella]
MIANLPLLFASGAPSALSKITASELEKFITFMVTCSWGHDTAKEIRQPPWWPKDVKFSHPFVRPPYQVPRDWEARLKNVVKRCYDYHKSAFLLVFSAQLARYPRKRLRYVDNRDQTTSLYYRPSGRLLVTFRNENLYYDKPTPVEVEKPQIKSTDIYLCDNCDSHFDNLEILKAHERLCNSEPTPALAPEPSDKTNSGQSETPTRVPNSGLPEFLSALKLQPIGEKNDLTTSVTEDDTRPRNSRTAANIDRGPPYPFSSLAYMKNIKQNVQRDMSYSRERVERYCCTSIPISKNLGSKSKNQQFPVRYRRPIDYWHRRHVFPNQRKKKILDIKAQLLLLKCKPISITIERMSETKIKEYLDFLRQEAESRYSQDKDIIFVDGMDCDQPAEVEKSADPLKRPEVDCEVIDLCSDDESSVVNENCDPQASVTGITSMTGVAGVACVMRGGAVLRRTAATPLAQPSQPCGARQRPLSTAVLQPHPVILITHSLNSLQTISLD